MDRYKFMRGSREGTSTTVEFPLSQVASGDGWRGMYETKYGTK